MRHNQGHYTDQVFDTDGSGQRGLTILSNEKANGHQVAPAELLLATPFESQAVIDPDNITAPAAGNEVIQYTDYGLRSPVPPRPPMRSFWRSFDRSWIETAASNRGNDTDENEGEQAVNLVMRMDEFWF